MEEISCTLPLTVAGLNQAIARALSLRSVGFKTRLVEQTICGFPVLCVLATPPPRAETPFQRLNAELNRGKR
jgi:hypothetical protein